MCGIVGGLGKYSYEIIANNLDSLTRRGPDHQSLLKLDNSLTFGATRLAMTDPHPRSNQPMVDKTNGNVIVFNGEIYNFKSIRSRLQKSGHIFVTESDTEVLLRALSVYGSEIIPKLEGMFAFVFYNKLSNKLIMARDYLGKKPLYYHIDNSELFFSSQISFVKKFIKTCSLNPNSILTFIKLGYLIDPSTMYTEIQSISPGQILTIDLRKVSIDSNDNFVPQAIESPSGLSLPETIEAALLERVEGHNHAALSLSGGYDSTILASELARLQFPVTTFSMKFNNSDKEKFSSDALHAEQIAKKLGLNNVVIEMPTADKIEVILQEYVMAMEEPNSNPTGLSMMVLYKEIFNRGNRLVLTGDGADEVFGGYERFNLANKFHKTPKINSKFLNKIIITKNPRLGWLSKLSYVLEPNQSIESWLYWHLICGNSMTDRLHISNQMASIHIFGDELINLFGNDKSACLLYRDLRTWLSMESNKKLDRISMWHSTEARSPFQSEHVIGNGFRLMNKENFRKNKKEIFLNSFPVLTELPTIPKKTGFISPLGYWLRNNESLINKSISGLQDFMSLDSKLCKELKNSPKEYDFYRMRVLWNLIVLNCWYQSQL